MSAADMTHRIGAPVPARVASAALKALRVAVMLLGPVGLLALAIIVRYSVFEYFHGGEHTLHALRHALGL